MRIRFLLSFLICLPARADVYTRQPGLDVLHYEISLELSDTSNEISGSTRVHAMLREDGIRTIWLDFDGMKVLRVRSAGTALSYKHERGRLSLPLDRPYTRNEIATIEIEYRGRPEGKGIAIGKNKYGRRVFFAENWPDQAHHWFPCIDHPSDKATVEFAITAPEKYDVVSNGRLVETSSLLDGRKRTRWEESVPIPTYCMVFGAAEFSVTHAGWVHGIPLLVYSYPQDTLAALKRFARSNLMLQYFTDLIGPYPYEKLAQVESTTRIGGMENSSVIFYAEGGFQRPTVAEGPVPHEIAHQWFGDSITESDWDHLWISEGFATYFSALFYEHLEGLESMKRTMARAAESVKQYHKTRPVSLIDPEQTDLMKKLNPFNYQKGAWVLHMLRKVLGDETFFRGIRRYYNVYAGRNASTENFQMVMESVSGQTLDRFFHQWFHQPGWPEYRVSWRWDEGAKEAELRFEQGQTTGLFEMPVEVVFRMEGREDRRTVQVGDKDQKMRVGLPQRPTSIDVDPDGWILKSVEVINP